MHDGDVVGVVDVKNLQPVWAGRGQTGEVEGSGKGSGTVGCLQRLQDASCSARALVVHGEGAAIEGRTPCLHKLAHFVETQRQGLDVLLGYDLQHRLEHGYSIDGAAPLVPLDAANTLRPHARRRHDAALLAGLVLDGLRDAHEPAGVLLAGRLAADGRTLGLLQRKRGRRLK